MNSLLKKILVTGGAAAVALSLLVGAAFVVPGGGGGSGGVSDGDKGDVLIAGSGSSYTIQSHAGTMLGVGHYTNRSDSIFVEDPSSPGVPMLWLYGTVSGPSVVTYGNNLSIGFLNRTLTVESNENRFAWGNQPYGSFGLGTSYGIDQVAASNFLAAKTIRLSGITAGRALVANASGDVTNAAGVPDGTKFLRDDNTYAVPPGGSATPGGTWGMLQFNFDGAFAGATNAIWTNNSLSIGTGRHAESTLQLSNNQATIFVDGPVSGALERMGIRPHYIGTEASTVTIPWSLGVQGTSVVDLAHQRMNVRPELVANTAFGLSNSLWIAWAAKTNAATINAGNGINQYANLVDNTNLTFVALAGANASNSVAIKVVFTQDGTGTRTLTFNGTALGIDTNALAATECLFWIGNGVTNVSVGIPYFTSVPNRGQMLTYSGVAWTNDNTVASLRLSPNGVDVVLKPANSNSLNVTNIFGVLEKAAASVVELNCNDANRFRITNRVGAATSLIVTNGAPEQEISITVLGEASGGASHVVTIIPQLGHLVANLDAFGSALATSFSFTLTNGNAVEINALQQKLNGSNVVAVVTRQYAF